MKDTYEFDYCFEFEGQTWLGHDNCVAVSLNSARRRLRNELKKQKLTNIHLQFTGISNYDVS